MPYRKQFTGSPWQQGGPPFGMNQMSGGMGGSGFGFGGGGGMGMGSMDNQFAMAQNMMNNFGRNQGYGGGFGGGMGPMGMNMNYGMGNMSRNMKDRGNRQNNFRNQRKRPMHRSPMGNSRNKRQNYEVSVVQRNRIRKRSRNTKIGRNNYSRPGRNNSSPRRRIKSDSRSKDDGDEEKSTDAVECELYNPAEPTDDFSEYEYEDGDEIEEDQEGDEDQEDEEKDKDKEKEKEKEEQQESTEKNESQEEEEEDTAKPSEEGENEIKEIKEERKSEDDEKKEENTKSDDKENSKNSIQVTIQQGTKGRSVSQDKKQGSSKKPLVCHVCKIVCSTAEKFRNHMNGRGHKMKMETLLVLQRERAQALEARMKASHQMRMVDMRDSSKGSSGKGKKNQNWCTVCECPFVGNFLSHRRTKEHRRKRDKKYPKCRPCRMGFSNPDEYKDHCITEDHKKKASQFHSFRSQDSDDDFLIVDATGIFEDEDKKRQHEEKVAVAVSEQIKDLLEEEKIEETPEPKTTEESENSEIKVEEEKPIALSSVLLVHGYYCKVCYKFFKYELNAKVEHCKLNSHILNNYKKNSKSKKAEKEREEKELHSEKSIKKEKKDSEGVTHIKEEEEDEEDDNSCEEQDITETEEQNKTVEEVKENPEISNAETTKNADNDCVKVEENDKADDTENKTEEIKETEEETPMETDEKTIESEEKEEEKTEVVEKKETEITETTEPTGKETETGATVGVTTRRGRSARGRNKRKS